MFCVLPGAPTCDVIYAVQRDFPDNPDMTDIKKPKVICGPPVCPVGHIEDGNTHRACDRQRHPQFENAPQASYTNSRRMLKMHFGFEKSLSSARIVAYAKATGLL